MNKILALLLFSSLYPCSYDDGFTLSERRKIAQAYRRDREFEMFDTFRPLGKYLLVRLNPKEEKTSGGLFMVQPARDKEEQRVATVIAVGPEINTIMVGDVIFIGRILVKANDDMCILKEEDVLGVID